MKTILKKGSILSLALFLCHSLWAEANASIGTIIVTVNQVIAKQKTVERTLSRGSPLYLGDIVVTGKNSSAQIKYSNGTLVSLEPNTNYQTLAYNDSAQATTSLAAKIDQGALQYSSSSKKKAILQTPVIALGIMGTVFQVIVPPGGNNIFIKVTEGVVIAGNVAIGPEQSQSSGSFNQSGVFTPGSIPWEQYSAGGELETISSNTSASEPSSSKEGPPPPQQSQIPTPSMTAESTHSGSEGKSDTSVSETSSSVSENKTDSSSSTTTRETSTVTTASSEETTDMPSSSTNTSTTPTNSSSESSNNQDISVLPLGEITDIISTVAVSTQLSATASAVQEAAQISTEVATIEVTCP